MRRIICNLRPADSISRRDDDHGALHGSADGLAGSVAGATDRLAVISTESNLGPAHLPLMEIVPPLLLVPLPLAV